MTIYSGTTTHVITILDNGLDRYTFTVEVIGNYTDEDAKIDAIIYALDKGIQLSPDFLVLVD